MESKGYSMVRKNGSLFIYKFGVEKEFMEVLRGGLGSEEWGLEG